MKWVLLWVFISVNVLAAQQKIVGLLMVRNEEPIIEQCLRMLSCYCDAIIVLDDASSDKTPQIIRTLARELPIERLLINHKSGWETKTEAHNRQLLLNAGREIGGTHFIVIDADELLSAQCMHHNWLRNQITQLKQGQALVFQMPHVWRNINYYRDDDSRWSPHNCWCACIFCDDRVSNYSTNLKESYSGFIHINRLPSNRNKTEKDIYIHDLDYSLIHFRFINWDNIMLKRAWYMCLELIRSREQLSVRQKTTAKHINFFYSVIEDFSEHTMHLKESNQAWFTYPFFNVSCYMQLQQWRKNQIQQWFTLYGKEFFKELDIWHLSL